MSSLHTKLLGILLIVCGVFGVAIGYLILDSAEQRVVDDAKARLERIAERYRIRVDHEIEEKAAFGEAANKLAATAIFLPNSHPHAPSQYARDEQGALRSVSADGTSGALLSSRSALTPEIEQYMAATEHMWSMLGAMVSGEILNLYVITKDNFIRISPPGRAESIEADHDFSGDLIYCAVDPKHDPDRSPVWTPPYYDSLRKKWMISLIVPLYRGEEFFGVTGSDYFLEDTFTEIGTAEGEVGDLGRIVLFDGQGNVLVCSDCAVETRNRQPPASDHPGLNRFLARCDLPSSGGQIISSYQEGPTANWICATGLESRPLFLGVYETQPRLTQGLAGLRRNLLIALIVGVILLAGVLALAIRHTILNRLLTLERAVRAFARGETPRYPPVQRDELGSLAGAFQSMAENLLHHRANLEQQVEARTAELRESEELYRVLAENIQIGITLMNADHEIVMVNANQARMFQRSPADFVGKKCFKEFERRDGVCGHCPGVRAMATGRPHEAETWGVRLDGSSVPVRVQAFPVFGPDGRASGFVEVVEDITERKQAEQDLRKRVAEIERFNRMALRREHRVLELKRKINELSKLVGQSAPHNLPLTSELAVEQQADEEAAEIRECPPEQPEAADRGADYELTELLDLEQMQQLLNSFCGVVGIAAALIDLEGNILIGSRWQRICTDFHRVNPQTLKRCIESDTKLANQLKAGETFTLYQCCNGLTDAASPVKINGRHVANMFVGQFLLEPADEQSFKRQAAEFGFDETDYLAALSEVPVVQRKKLPLILDFLVSFARATASIGMERLQAREAGARLSKHAAELNEQREAAMNLAEDAEEARIAAERSEAALRTSEERFRTVVSAARDAIVVMGGEGEITLWSPGAEAMFGWAAEEVLGKPVHRVLVPARHQEAHDQTLRSFRAAGFSDAVGKTVEMAVLHKDGHEFPAELALSALDLNGRWGAVGLLRDITERRQAEERLRGALDRAKELEFIIDRSPATVWLWKAEAGWPVEYVSDSVIGFGYTPDELMSGRVAYSAIVHADDLPRVAAEVAKYTREGRNEFTQEYRIITKAGEVRWVDDWSWIRRTADGEVSHYQGVTLDITERKRAEQQQLAHLRFLECMARIERAIRGTDDINQMLSDTLETLLSVFECDRAWLLHPCDPKALSWTVPFERTTSEYRGLAGQGAAMPMTEEAVEVMKAALESDGAVTYGPHSAHRLPPDVSWRFHIQSQMAMALRTKVGAPWLLGLHQCSWLRTWTDDEKRLFEEIGRRIGDSLAAMLTLRDLRESEQRFRAVVEQATDSVLLFTPQGQILDANKQICDCLGYSREELLSMNVNDIDPTVEKEEHRQRIWEKLQPGQSATIEGVFRRKNGSTTPVEVSLGVLELDGQRVFLGLSRDISQRKRMEDELRTAASTDKLTGLPNRALFLDRLQQAVLRAERLKDYHFAVLFLDFDRFKIINDSLGHKIGDLLLQQAASRLRAAVRTGDSLIRQASEHTTARLGGDEFVVLLDGIQGPDGARIVADRLLETLSRPYRLGEHEVYSTASIGIVTSDIVADSAENILRDADTAMYEAKLAGKGRYVVFDVSMRQRVQNRLSLENDLRKALDANQLFLVYQPIVSLSTREIESFEALLRWQHPDRGLISPVDFVPIAEDTGLIVPIGEWVLREACRQYAEWRRTEPANAPRNISVNLSRNQLLLTDLPAMIRRVLQETGLPPSSLHVEITESAVMRDVNLAMQILSALKEIGVKLDMDDFGTGHSSLACLHQFPFDVLKIDRSFVANVDRGRDLAALVHAVITLARNLNIKVVAEGIETVDQLVTLQSLGCQFGQGYFFSKPMTPADAIKFQVQPVPLPGAKTPDASLVPTG